MTTGEEPVRSAGSKTSAGIRSITQAGFSGLVVLDSQRRIRLAPEFKYDSLAGWGGIFDEFSMYSGHRTDMNLSCRQERDFRSLQRLPRTLWEVEKVITPQHFNPTPALGVAPRLDSRRHAEVRQEHALARRLFTRTKIHGFASIG